MPFWMRIRVGPENHALDRGPDPLMERDNLRGEGRPIIKYRDTLQSSVRKQLNLS